ncbi:MAG: reactive intermediate/imine deaminase [Verrucomicrobia bacterium]|nr:MAG: reactive intermediate/imine deaminase [Verrucomicrobiota bacterium]
MSAGKDKLPPPAGPYSHFRRAGNLIFVSGQLPVKWDGELATEIGAATAQAIENLRTVLQSAGADLANVVKTTVFLADIRDFAAMNEMYARYFGAQPPARSSFQVAALPKGARVEIEAIAAVE